MKPALQKIIKAVLYTRIRKHCRFDNKNTRNNIVTRRREKENSERPSHDYSAY